MTRAQTPLQLGDVIVHKSGRRYTVVGFSPRGKTRMISPHRATELVTWWATREDLPRNYRYAMTLGRR